MRSNTRLRSLLALLILTIGMIAGTSGALSHAQEHDATPAPGPAVTTEVLGSGEPDAVTGQTLWLLRVTFEPGAVAAPHTHPGATVFFIESGEIDLALVEGTATLTRAGGTPDEPMPSEELSAGSEVVLSAGDKVFYQEDAVLDEVNNGDEPVVILLSNIRGTDEPAREPAATPAA
ncbi:MAG: cupin domain-containing protein [Chloroflexia bacterium]|jgi:predicted metal-dependent enzyme (double-stranded beta helix superfamily)|nr:cupin domain-containing protein [Chloroflexia bacterium]